MSTASARNSFRYSNNRGPGCAPPPSDRSRPGVFFAVARKMMRENGPGAEPGVSAEESRGPVAMHNPIDPSQMSADDEPDDRLEAALQAAFGPPSTADARARRGVLEA